MKITCYTVLFNAISFSLGGVQASTNVQQSTPVSHHSSSFSSFIAASSSSVSRNSSIVIGNTDQLLLHNRYKYVFRCTIM